MSTKNRKLILILLCTLAAFLSLSDRSTALSPTPPTSLAGQEKLDDRGLTQQEKRGKAFYLRSESASGQEVTAILGEIDVPAATLTCAGCHGARGQGKTEGGVTAGNLTWSHLTKPYGHTHEGGRKHSAFSETSFIHALTAGLDPAGNKLSVAMPTYRLPQQDMADLIAYLKRIETDRDPGLTETSLVLGTVLPDKGPLADLGQAMREVLQAYFHDVNSQGGIYNRKIELRIAAAAGDPTSTIANTKRLIEESQVMTKPRILLLLVLLLVPSLTFAQKSRSSWAAANASWPSFYSAFRAAVNKRDSAAMLRMMPDDFFDGGGGATASEWLRFIEENAKNGSWRDLQNSFARGTVINRDWSSKGIPTRVTKDNGYYFEFRKDKKWYFAGVVGD